MHKKLYPELIQSMEPGTNAKRQVEIFTQGGDMYLRIHDINSGNVLYTLQLSEASGEELIASVEAGLSKIRMNVSVNDHRK